MIDCDVNMAGFCLIISEEPQEKKQKLNEEETDFAVAYIVRVRFT